MHTDAGSRYKTEYIIELDKDGKKQLKAVGKTNVYEIIQESLEETKIENIIRRATLGDTSVLEKLSGQFMDISEMPKTFMEMQNMIIKARQEFDKLPLEIKKNFDFSAEQYINELGTEKFMKKLGYVEPAELKEEVPAAEPKGDVKDE